MLPVDMGAAWPIDMVPHGFLGEVRIGPPLGAAAGAAIVNVVLPNNGGAEGEDVGTFQL